MCKHLLSLFSHRILLTRLLRYYCHINNIIANIAIILYIDFSDAKSIPRCNLLRRTLRESITLVMNLSTNSNFPSEIDLYNQAQTK